MLKDAVDSLHRVRVYTVGDLQVLFNDVSRLKKCHVQDNVMAVLMAKVQSTFAVVEVDLSSYLLAYRVACCLTHEDSGQKWDRSSKLSQDRSVPERLWVLSRWRSET